jgi:hypothetical protein
VTQLDTMQYMCAQQLVLCCPGHMSDFNNDATDEGDDNNKDESDDDGNESDDGKKRNGGSRPRRPHLQGRFSGRLETKADEKKLADECRYGSGRCCCFHEGITSSK